jgi:hypothetical protein
MSKRVILIAGMLLFSATASAGLVPVGDPIEGDSWNQGFNESGIGNFDLVAVRMSAGGPFQSPTHRNLGSGWSLLYEDSLPTPSLASASGPGVTSLTWSIHFAGLKTSSLTFDYVAFNGSTIANAAHAVWGPNWSITNYGTNPSPYWNPSRPDVIPAPGAALLGLIGLGVVARIRRCLA